MFDLKADPGENRNLGADRPEAVKQLGDKLAAWREAGLPLASDRRTPPDAACIDVYLRPYDRNDGVEAAMREYLSWEIDLVHEVARDGDVRFGEAVAGGR